MYKGKRISLVMPCYNEEEGLDGLLKVRPQLIDETIVVDNDSTDSTADIARKYAAKVIFLKERGYGAAYRKGLSDISGDIVVLIDGDGSYPVSAIEKFLVCMDEGKYDFLTGCRFPLAVQGSMPFIKVLANRFTSYLIRKFFRIGLADSQSGMFVFRKAILDKILPLNDGMEFSQEIKLNAWLDPGIKSGEVHISYQKRVGKVKFRAWADSVRTLTGLFLFLQRRRRQKSI